MNYGAKNSSIRGGILLPQLPKTILSKKLRQNLSIVTPLLRSPGCGRLWSLERETRTSDALPKNWHREFAKPTQQER